MCLALYDIPIAKGRQREPESSRSRRSIPSFALTRSPRSAPSASGVVPARTRSSASSRRPRRYLSTRAAARTLAPRRANPHSPSTHSQYRPHATNMNRITPKAATVLPWQPSDPFNHRAYAVGRERGGERALLSNSRQSSFKNARRRNASPRASFPPPVRTGPMGSETRRSDVRNCFITRPQSVIGETVSPLFESSLCAFAVPCGTNRFFRSRDDGAADGVSSDARRVGGRSAVSFTAHEESASAVASPVQPRVVAGTDR